MIRARIRVRRDRGLVTAGVVGVLVAALFGWFFLEHTNLQQQVEASAADEAERQATVEVLAEDVRTLRGQLEDEGVEPEAPPPEERLDDLPPLPGPPGERGPDPTTAQVEDAVRSYLVANPPEPGRPPTEAEVAAAVSAFCTVRGDCIGLVGATGATGAPGPVPTDDQVAAAVSAFCADGNCQGPAGEPGQPGTPGRGIVSIACGDDNNWLITFTDDTTQTVEGPCRFPPGQEPGGTEP